MIKYGNKQFRFEVYDYFEIYPYLDREFEFHGNCPVTGKKDGLILIEHPLQIKLPYINKEFKGEGYSVVIRPFLEYIFGKKSHLKLKQNKRKFEINKLHSSKAKDLNDRCMVLSQMSIEKAYSILLHNKQKILGLNSCAHLDMQLVFFLNENHHLYHPDSDNILSWSDTLISYMDLEKNEPHVWTDDSIKDWNDTPYYKNFKHCYIFHDLFSHRSVNLIDLMQVDSVAFDFNLNFDKNHAFLK